MKFTLNIVLLATSLTFAVVTGPSAHGAGPTHPLVGTWRGFLTETAENELAVHHVDRRQVHGRYCVRKPGQILWYDFHPGAPHGGVEAHAGRNSVTTKLGFYRLRFKHKRSSDTVEYRARSTNHIIENELSRMGEPGPCEQRIHPLPVEGIENTGPAGQTVADQIASVPEPRHPLIGSWTGTRESGFRIEMSITAIADGAITGLYCNTWATGQRAIDMGPDFPRGIHAIATQDTVEFDIRDRHFEFVTHADGDSMVYTQTRPTATEVLEMQRTTEPLCASRVVARAAPR